MSVFKSEYSRSLRVIPSDDSNVPYPNPISSGTNTSVGIEDFYLINIDANFIVDGVKTGDIVYNRSDSLSATVVEVISETELFLNGNIFTSIELSEYTIYQASPQSGSANSGCYLYIGLTGNVRVTTIGQDNVLFVNAQAGSVIPVQVIKVHSNDSGTSAANINALW